MTDKLKPCPFCGGEAEVVRVNSGEKLNPVTITNEYIVSCHDCGVRTKRYESKIWQDEYGHVIIDKNGAVDAIEKWNRRASNDQTRSD